MSGTLVLGEALKKELRPRRAIAGSATAPTEAAAKRVLARIPKAYAEKPPFGGTTTHADILAAGMNATPPPELRALQAAADAFLRSPSVESLRDAEVEPLAAAVHMLARADHELDLLGAIAALRGVPDALRVATRSTFLQLTAGNGGWTTAVWLVTADGRETRAVDSWLSLRHAVCAADATIYATARETARDLRRSLELRGRARLAWLFPDEPWADEDLAEWLVEKPPEEPSWRESSCLFLLSAATDVATIQKALATAPGRLPTYAVDLAPVVPPAVMIAWCAEELPRLLAKPKFGPLLKTPPRVLAQVLACFRSPEAAAVLAPYAANAVLGSIVLGFFRDAPELADAATDASGAKGAAAVERVASKTVAAASASALPTGATPPVLGDRPWRAKKGKAPAVPVLERPALLGLDEEQVVLPESIPSFPHDAGAREMTSEELEAWRGRVEGAGWAHADYEHHRAGNHGPWTYTRVPAAEARWAWNERKAYLAGSPVTLVAKHGLAVLPGFLQREWVKWLGQSEDEGGMFHAARCLVSPRIAPLVARVASRRKKYRRVARAWLAEHPRIAAFGLVPDAVGTAGEARDDAEEALRDLERQGHGDVVREVAQTYGEDALRIVSALLARDPLAIAVTPPKRPAFLRLAELPAVVIREGARVLDADGVDALIEMLQVTPLAPPYPGIALVREALDAASLGALSAELVEQWLLGDAPGRHEWMLFAVVHFPSEAGTRRVAALAREWARKDQAKAVRACAALAALGTDVALLHLSHIAETTRFDTLKKETGALLLEVADARELTLDELGDLTVPDAGLGPDGTARFSYGERSFVVTLDETLRPVVSGQEGKAVLRSLPRATKTDDAAAAKEARVRFDRLKEDLEAVADRQRRRLERAMTTGRTWSVAVFRSRIVQHPLLVHVARRLVWAASGGGRAECTFRVAEDSTFADEDDRAVDLSPDAIVRIAHPARDASLGKTWARVFGDYAILQPFEQLSRTTYAIEEHERTATQLDRVAGITAPARKVLGVLESRGFRRDNAGSIGAYLRTEGSADGTDLTLRVPLSPSITIEDLSSCADPVLEAPTLADRAGAPATFGALTAASFSEVVRDLEALRDAGR